MKLQLDTHTFIWWDSEPERLSQQVLSMIQNPNRYLFFISYKVAVKLKLKSWYLPGKKKFSLGQCYFYGAMGGN